jgi:DNA invertase Pin-like site-specific DNA recombinase
MASMRLDGYIRVSRTAGREGESFISPKIQREQIEGWAKLRGVHIAAWHEDMDQSGGKLERPGLSRALERIRGGKTGGLAVARLDRFSRAGVADALRVVEEIHDAGGEIAAVDLGIDPTTPFGEFAMTLMLGLARMQRRQIADSWRESQRRAVARGVHIASRPPTAYVRRDDGRLFPQPEHGPHVTEVFRMKASGASWRELAEYLRAHEVPSPYGSIDWQPRSLVHLISNRAYLGEARSGKFVNPDAHEPLIDAETWQAAQEAKGEKPANGTGGALLSGLVRCAGCSYVLKPDTMNDRGTRRRMYRCRGARPGGKCPAPASVLGSVIEPYVVRYFFDALGGMTAQASALTEEVRTLESACEKAEREVALYRDNESLAALGDDYVKGLRNRVEKRDKLFDKLEASRARAGVADLPPTADLEKLWPDLDVVARRHLLHAALDVVFVRRGRMPIEERTRVLWSGEGPSDLPGPGRRLGIQAFVFD